MSRYTWVLQYNPCQTYCNTIHSSQPTTHSCNTICCIAIQLKPKLHYGHNTMVYCDTTPATQSAYYCNTITALQNNSHNIIWAVAQPTLLHQQNFFFFINIYYLFQPLEIPKKNIHILIFIFFSSSNSTYFQLLENF